MPKIDAMLEAKIGQYHSKFMKCCKAIMRYNADNACTVNTYKIVHKQAFNGALVKRQLSEQCYNTALTI